MHRRSTIRRLVPLVFAATLFVTYLVASGRPVLEDIQWMVGHWAGTQNGVEMEELWTAPKGGVMLGLHRDVASGRPAFFEYLRIEERSDAVVYIASPRGEGATEFLLTSVDGETAVFENPDHDFPQRIIYRRVDDRLIARVEGEVGGETKSREWEWQLLE